MGGRGRSDRERAKPQIRSTLHVEATDVAARVVVLIEAGILRILITRRGASGITGDAEGVREPVLDDVGREIAEDVEVPLRVVDLGAEGAEHRRTEIPRAHPESQIQTGREIGMRAPDDRAVVRVDFPIAVDVEVPESADLSPGLAGWGRARPRYRVR